MPNKLPSAPTGALASFPGDDDMLNSLPPQLARLYHGFVALVDRLRSEDGGKLPHLRPGAGSVYLAILKHAGCTVTELAGLLKMPKPTISGLLDGLERDGVIERKPCPDDGRAIRLRLTRFGQSLERGFCKRHERAISILEAGLTRAEAAELRRMLRVVLGNLDHVREEGLQASKPARSSTRRKAA